MATLTQRVLTCVIVIVNVHICIFHFHSRHLPSIFPFGRLCPCAKTKLSRRIGTLAFLDASVLAKSDRLEEMRAHLAESRARGRAWRGRRGRGATVARSASATAPPRTNDERVRRMPRGRPPLYRRWDESVGAWVLDEAGEALERRQLELPPLASRPDDLNAWAVANPPPRRDDFATQELLDEAREYPGTRCCWASGYRRTARTPSVRRRGVWPACDPLSARCPTTSRRSVP